MGPGEVHLAKFPFGGTIGAKIRPVLLLTGPLGTVPELLTAYMTSVMPAKLLPSDLMVDPNDPEHACTSLRQVTWLRLHKLATIHDTDVVRHLGSVSAPT
jgi:hypothetical protein